ncbi:pre-rRNA processing protein, partial [Spiromyces aspiralis]
MKPNINDAALSSSWHRIIARGYAAYAKQDPELCFAALPDIFDTLFSDLELGKPAAQQTAATTLRALLVKCVPKSHKTQDPAVMSRLVKSLAGGLGYRFKPVWAVVLLLIAVAFNSLGKQARPALDPLLELVSSLRMEPDFELKAEADATLGAAVSAIGPEVFLSVLPLNIDAVTGKDKNAVGRAWLLPLMKDYIEHAPLGYFTDTLLPTADLLSKHRDEFKAKRRTVESRVFGALNQQVWALFSGFCDAPLDVTVKFSSDFAARLGSEIHESPELRSYICTGIQRL